VRKSRLEALLGVLLSIITALSIGNIFTEKLSSDCQLEINEMNTNLTQSIYWNILQQNENNFLMTSFLIKNYSEAVIESEHSIVISIPESARNLTGKYFEDWTNTQKDIFNITKKIDEKRKDCENTSFWVTVLLYIELIFAISCLFITVIIFKNYT
jgi:hypothetical protein